MLKPGTKSIAGNLWFFAKDCRPETVQSFIKDLIMTQAMETAQKI